MLQAMGFHGMPRLPSLPVPARPALPPAGACRPPRRTPGTVLSTRAAAKTSSSTPQPSPGGDATGFRGVSYAASKYKVRKDFHGKTVYFGQYDNARDAAEQYDRVCWAFAPKRASSAVNFGDKFKPTAMADLGREASVFAAKIEAAAKAKDSWVREADPGNRPTGVHYDPSRNKPYYSRIEREGVKRHLGWYSTLAEAQAAYEKATAELPPAQPGRKLGSRSAAKPKE